jgi:hypothetical protein
MVWLALLELLTKVLLVLMDRMDQVQHLMVAVAEVLEQ